MLHQHMVLFHFRGFPAVRRLAVEQPRGALQACSVGDQPQATGSAAMGRVNDENAFAQHAEIERGGACLGADAIKAFEPGKRGLDRPLGQEIERQRAALLDNLVQGAGNGGGLALRPGDVLKDRLDRIRSFPGQRLPADAMPRQLQECRQGDLVARSGAQDRQNHLADRTEAHAFRRRPERRQKTLMNVRDPVE